MQPIIFVLLLAGIEAPPPPQLTRDEFHAIHEQAILLPLAFPALRPQGPAPETPKTKKTTFRRFGVSHRRIPTRLPRDALSTMGRDHRPKITLGWLGQR